MKDTMGIQILVITATLAAASDVAAYCPQAPSYGNQSLAAQVNDQLDWHLCLHNEQVTSLNGHAAQLNNLADNLSGLAGLIRMEGDRIDGVAIRERDDNEEMKALQQRVSELERRIQMLERLLVGRQ